MSFSHLTRLFRDVRPVQLHPGPTAGRSTRRPLHADGVTDHHECDPRGERERQRDTILALSRDGRFAVVESPRPI